jgi:hypothetical protein
MPSSLGMALRDTVRCVRRGLLIIVDWYRSKEGLPGWGRK